ncbi:MAG: PilT/PilU family type 4a pilus ATPase, partial [Crinalium sp.]
MPTEQPVPAKDSAPSIALLVRHAHANKASDIHLRVGEVPRYRIRGQLVPFGKPWKLSSEIFKQYLKEILTPAQIQEFTANKELDTAIFYPGFLRCRINCFESLTGGAIVIRLISLNVPSIDSLGLPPVLKKIVSRNEGLILVTGATGSGKSTTLAAMIRYLNETTNKHIVTIEDPIEYVHTSENCLISQREVGLHTHDFHHALRSVLREDPDVILIGEMRDRITVNTALQAAQTGHLVLGSLHTRNAINAINRLLNLYEANEQQAMRIQITESLIAVVAQMLVPTIDQGRVAVHEILINTPAMQDYLLKGEEDEALRLMETNTTEGMQILN